MTELLERELRALFAEEAGRAPRPVDLASRARARVVRTRRRVAWGAGLLAAASVAASVTTVALVLPGASDPEPRAAQEPRTAAGPTPTDDRSGPLTSSAVTSCVEQYSPRTVAELGFAFDGTVTAIGRGVTDRPGSGQLGYAGVTFEVDEWFAGGDTATVTVDMARPTTESADGESLPSYEVGTRLLVSGQPRWGGAPLDDPIAWGCGFTRYYDAETADRWRTGTE